MKTLLSTLLTLTLLSCASTTTRSDLENAVTDNTFMQGSILSQADILNNLAAFREKYPKNIDPDAYSITQNFIKKNNYSKLALDYAKSQKEYDQYAQFYGELVNTSLSRKIEMFKLKEYDPKEFEDYITNFQNLADANERFSVTEKLIENDFPNAMNAQLIATLVLKTAERMSMHHLHQSYNIFLGNIKVGLLKVNLYIFKNVPLDDLKELIERQKSKKYQDMRIFIEKVQTHTSKVYLEQLEKKLTEKPKSMITM